MNQDVRRIQSALDRSAFKLNITGEWDVATCQALLDFQASKYGTSKQRYLDSETFMDIGFDPKTADRLEASYGHICGGVGPAPSTYGNTVGKSLVGQVRRIQRALRVRETGKLDQATCAALSGFAQNVGATSLINRKVLEKLGFTSTEAEALAGQFAFAQCTARGRAVVAGVGLAYPGFSGVDADAYGQSDQNEQDDWENADTCEDPADTAAVWNAVLPGGHSWCTATPSGLAMTADWVLVDSSCNGIKRRQWSSNNGEPYFQFWRTLTNEERWACPKQTVTPRRTQLIKLMQESLLDMGYAIGKADGIAGPKTCQAAYVEQFKQGNCGKDVLQEQFFESLGFSKAEIKDAMTYVSGVCRGNYTNAYACANPEPPKPPKPDPVKPPVTPPAPTCAGPTLPAGMAWCSGQPAGSTLYAKATAVANCTGWTRETWTTKDGAQHVKFYNAAKKLTKWACAKSVPTPIGPDDVQPATEKAGWAWWVAAGLAVVGIGVFAFNKQGGKGKRR
jgi:peptidoglycan hydrolase-like protein with peptidoglycan-binding domain